MYHATTKDLQPARVLANRAAFATAYKTFHIHLCRWLREREVGCTKARSHILPKHAPSKVNQRTFQIGEGDVLANNESFHLIELNFRTCGDLLIAEAHPGQRDTNRRWVIRVHCRELAHCVDLPRRCMRAKYDRVITALASFDKECVLHVTCGMMGREVEQLKIDLIRFHFARGINLKSHIR